MKKNIGPVMAAFLGSALAIFFVGFFQLMAEGSEGFKSMLVVHSGIGPLSGKVLYGYLIGFIVFLASYAVLKNRQEGRIEPFLYFFVLMLLLATLFSYVPFAEFVFGD